MAEEFLQCPYSKQCSIHHNFKQDYNLIEIHKRPEGYTCINPADFMNAITNCTYLHQLANEDKQTELLEKILIELSPKKIGESSPDLNEIDHP